MLLIYNFDETPQFHGVESFVVLLILCLLAEESCWQVDLCSQVLLLGFIHFQHHFLWYTLVHTLFQIVMLSCTFDVFIHIHNLFLAVFFALRNYFVCSYKNIQLGFLNSLQSSLPIFVFYGTQTVEIEVINDS